MITNARMIRESTDASDLMREGEGCDDNDCAIEEVS
jgi:hypothetical protein